MGKRPDLYQVRKAITIASTDLLRSRHTPDSGRVGTFGYIKAVCSRTAGMLAHGIWRLSQCRNSGWHAAWHAHIAAAPRTECAGVIPSCCATFGPSDNYRPVVPHRRDSEYRRAKSRHPCHCRHCSLTDLLSPLKLSPTHCSCPAAKLPPRLNLYEWGPACRLYNRRHELYLRRSSSGSPESRLIWANSGHNDIYIIHRSNSATTHSDSSLT